MKFKHTLLQKFEFGPQKEDQFYCLVDKRISPGGMNVEKIKLTDPRRIDAEFENSGCLFMLTGEEIAELTNRGELDIRNLHQSLYDAAISTGTIRRSEP